jgi:hypothetical protein
MIWVYAICDRPELGAPPDLDGVREGELFAVFGRQADIDPEPDALWAHERVVERLMEDRTVLPMRFGSRVADEDELRRVLADGHDSFVSMLGRVRGRVELGVRVLSCTPEHIGEAATGREYMLAKLSGGRRAAHATATVHEPLAGLAADSRRQAAGCSGELLRGAYLVDRGAVARFSAAVERLQEAHPDLPMLCTGPWPPYSFVREAGAIG